MNVAVLIKQTPDTAELPKVTVAEAESGQLQATMVINPWDEFAVEEAIDLSDRFGCETVAISLGRQGEIDVLKHALAMGVDGAVHVDESVIDGGDEWATAEALAAAVKKAGGGEDVELVLAGKMSVDGNSGVIYAGVACKLGWDLLVNVTRIVDIVDGTLIAEQVFEGGQETVEVPLPVVISVAKEINEPRYPSFMGIRKASRAAIPILGRDDLDVGPSHTTRWTDLNKPEPEDVQVRIFEGASVEDKAAQLADALMAERVI
ncbi:MAG: electron transfer flavoprotein subunit beta/FixA family protein [Caldilineaceae bacterium]|nr:electron transfer flavoprotein subunit beta/FixA family protein [Caldilineaceae bacterium]